MKEFNIIGERVCEYQGKLFEYSTKRFNCSSKIFLRRFLNSEILNYLDRNDDIYIPYTVDEALNSIEEEFGKTEYGSVKYSSDAMFWMGYMYRYISFTRETATNLLFDWFSPELLNKAYPAFHTQDSEWCVRSLLERSHLSEDIFDPNWRLLQVIKKYRKEQKIEKNN